MTQEKNTPINPETANLLTHDEILHMWKTPEFVKIDKGRRWYMTTGIILLLLITYAIFSGSATMAIVFILIGGMFFMIRNQEPRMQEIMITKLGVWIDEKFYAYSNIHSFWIVYEQPYIRTLYLQIGKGHKRISIQLNDQDPVLIRQLLSREIPETEDKHEDFTETLIRLFRLH